MIDVKLLRDNQGLMPGPSPDVSDAQLLFLIRAHHSPVVTSSIIAEKADMSVQNANYRLKGLENDGALESMKVGSAARVYWLTDTSRQIAASVSFEFVEDSGSQ
jgi:predicted transcriptional regulator